MEHTNSDSQPVGSLSPREIAKVHEKLLWKIVEEKKLRILSIVVPEGYQLAEVMHPTEEPAHG